MVVRYDYKGDAVEVVDVEMRFERKIGRLKPDGTLWAWGWNYYGQLGDGTTASKDTPTQESTGATNWSAIATGQWHSMAIK